MSGHTATPWVAAAHFAERHGGRTYIPILRPGNDPVPLAVVHRDVDGYGRNEGEANAALIVTACNSHADLVRALEFYADPLRYDGPNQRIIGDGPYTPKDRGYLQDVTRNNGDIARAALSRLASPSPETKVG